MTKQEDAIHENCDKYLTIQIRADERENFNVYAKRVQSSMGHLMRNYIHDVLENNKRLWKIK